MRGLQQQSLAAEIEAVVGKMKEMSRNKKKEGMSASTLRITRLSAKILLACCVLSMAEETFCANKAVAAVAGGSVDFAADLGAVLRRRLVAA